MASSNLLLAYPNRANAATFSAGSWLAALPVSNMNTRELYKVARSSNALTTSTRFQVDLGVARPLRVLALCNHNLSQSALWQVKLGSTAGAADIYNSGTRLAWQMSFSGLLDWESATWWLGASGDEYLRSPYAAALECGDTYNARYITIEITDTANVDGYVQIGRFFAGPAIQPVFNADYGLQDGMTDLSTFETSESGSAWFTARRRIRNATFVLGHLSAVEAAYLHELRRLCGTVDEIFYFPFPASAGEAQRYGFLGRMSELSAIEFPRYSERSTALRIEELA